VAQGYYKDHVKKLLNRINVFNGRLYRCMPCQHACDSHACRVHQSAHQHPSALCREDPSIFGFNLMNEPRSQNELYVVKRTTTDGSRNYNISYNPADDLQSWIENMAAYVKSIDPIHLLSTGARFMLHISSSGQHAV
jgi:mannan endo-1,4-beta-mannosidase